MLCVATQCTAYPIRHPGYAITVRKRGRPCRTCEPRRKPECRSSTSPPGTECTHPRNTLKPMVDALVTVLEKALKDPALNNRFAELSMTPVGRSERCLRRSNIFSRQKFIRGTGSSRKDSARSIMSTLRLCSHVPLEGIGRIQNIAAPGQGDEDARLAQRSSCLRFQFLTFGFS
jgi:hypothetical protein